jgi:PhzF family phenazine biosynthesis protein
MKTRPFKQIDVFTATPYLGNPLAAVLDGSGLSTAEMQRFTDWTNLSEATFLLPPEHPDADYKVRIFCPGRELPFAGHPTLGSCHAWLQAGGKPKSQHVVQECGVGLVRIKQDGARLAFAAPTLIQSGPLPEADVQHIARGLGVPRSDILHHAWCHNGPKWRGVMLASSEQVLALKPDGAILAGLDIGVVGAKPDGNDCAFEIRAFFHIDGGIDEDPVTGSLNAGVAQWLIGAGLAPPRYIASQGAVLGRAGRVHVEQVGEDIWIGGDSVTCVDGTVAL